MVKHTLLSDNLDAMINEMLISFIWRQRLLPTSLFTVDNKKVDVLSPGTLNSDQGPDFIGSELYFDNTLWSGNVEIHVKSSDWLVHCHQLDRNYDNVICHVVWNYDADVYSFLGDKIPTIELSSQIPSHLLSNYEYLMQNQSSIPCANLIGDVPRHIVFNMLETCFFESLGTKMKYVDTMCRKTCSNLDEASYCLISRSFGVKVNNDPFEATALSLPLNILMRYYGSPTTVESLLFGQANLLSDKYSDDYPRLLLSEYSFYAKKHNLTPQMSASWKLLRLHPANFPCVRMAQLAVFLNNDFKGLDSLLSLSSVRDVYSSFMVGINDYWSNHVIFDKRTVPKNRTIGCFSVDIIIINAIVPILYYYGKTHHLSLICDKALDLIENVSAENNKMVRLWKSLGITPLNAVHSQALIWLKREYCDKRRCLQCKIGSKIISSS
ncbi:MAG: DUF2851 family protein [Bacteroidales bacterium]|nr:DUF2851 family protein [Bacteroidales bacterium]